MSHNLWNVQTGWENLFARCGAQGISRFFLFADQSFFGDLCELFPDFVPDRNRISWVDNNGQIFREMLKNDYLLFTVKDEHFTKEFAARILAWARRACGAEFLAEVAQFRAAADPIVVTTIRLDNREWIEQRAGFPALFGKLRAEFPRLGLVIDGLSSDTNKGWTTHWMSMAADLAMAAAIRENLPPDMPVLFSVGRKFAESVVLNDTADLFIAPSGSGMALYKWISNMPGLAFSNKTVLDEEHPYWSLRVWHNPNFRADIVPTTHLASRLVTDGEVARGHHSRANFHLDWADLYEPAAQEIKRVIAEKAKV
jgi:hypothetical protein